MGHSLSIHLLKNSSVASKSYKLLKMFGFLHILPLMFWDEKGCEKDMEEPRLTKQKVACCKGYIL